MLKTRDFLVEGVRSIFLVCLNMNSLFFSTLLVGLEGRFS